MNRGTQALAGISVFDVAGSVAAAYCGKLFADHGAEVVLVEPPDSGFATRGLTPFVPGAAPPESSAMHSYLSTNKRSIVLDMDSPEDAAQFFELARDSALVIDCGIGGRRAVNPERLAAAAPHGVYRCAGSDRWLAVQVQNEAQWAGFREALGGLVAGFGSVADRLQRRGELDAAVTRWTRGRDARAAMNRLQAAGVPSGVVRPASDLTRDAHLQARGYWRIMERDFVGAQPNPPAPYRLVGAPFDIERPAPTLGRHNREILGGILGLSVREIADLAKSGIIGDRPRLPARRT